ncbi:MAG: type II toxin-antitoxin system PemK/MazF family toxin [Sulfuricurvum sp.]|uniref:type II toxin-antitoxin system PemK/MazF family toxin n=1 Tax=Sulfuricurvum sp. TaxID=2025608 RepID=UPI0026379713|nr:type II toxin-antitoxin system PemK/MazF family toxin [Sulfuricurvum sp.]MDD5160000.1 type II toxin-antitoxin system PemK/MazF family toxin [Sulfuricurvum sp.]
MVDKYIPQKGDLVILTFDPQAGHEQQGRRPALIISNDLFNERVGLAIACPITNTDRNFPFHVAVNSEHLSGFIMSEQVKSIDYNARKVKFVTKVDDEVLNHVLGLVESILL